MSKREDRKVVARSVCLQLRVVTVLESEPFVISLPNTNPTNQAGFNLTRSKAQSAALFPLCICHFFDDVFQRVLNDL
jgi:hypothetical protein